MDQNRILMPPRPLTNFEIQKYYQNESRFNGVYSRNNIPNKINDGRYITNLGEYADIGTHWIALYCKDTEIIYFDSFGVEHISKEIKKVIGNNIIKDDIFKVKSNNSIMCWYSCIGFIDFMLADKTLVDFTSLFSPDGVEKKWQHHFELF